MSEYLFRGKRLNNGEWKYGYYVKQYGAHQIYVSEFEGEYGFDDYHVDPETIGQYIRRTDRNGKKIFEGDIVIIHGAPQVRYYEIKFGQHPAFPIGNPYDAADAYGFYFADHKEDGDSLNDYVFEKLEVVGNIYDNPELLGENKYE